MLSYSALLSSKTAQTARETNWSVTHCFGVIYCNWCFYLVLRPSEAIACVCRKAYNPVGCIDWGCWLILLYWHVLMLSHCLTNRLRSKVKAHLAHCRKKKKRISVCVLSLFFIRDDIETNFFFVWYLNRLASSYNICYNNLAIIYVWGVS